MPKKQTSSTSTSQNVAGAVTARGAKPATSRARNAKHSKASAIEASAPALEIALPVEEEIIIEEIVIAAPEMPAPEMPAESAHDAIAKLAYSYWEARGYQGGNPLEDWVRAEEAYLQRGL